MAFVGKELYTQLRLGFWPEEYLGSRIFGQSGKGALGYRSTQLENVLSGWHCQHNSQSHNPVGNAVVNVAVESSSTRPGTKYRSARIRSERYQRQNHAMNRSIVDAMSRL